MKAAVFGRTDTLRILIAKGASVDGKQGNSALDLANSFGKAVLATPSTYYFRIRRGTNVSLTLRQYFSLYSATSVIPAITEVTVEITES